MFKRFSYIFAYLLLALMPLQSIAAANMLVCNSMMQTHSNNQQQDMPCHEHMASTTAADDNHQAKTAHTTDTHKATSKSTCGTLCSTLCAMTALAGNINTTVTANSSPLAGPTEQSYLSVTLPNTQRPPIFLS